MGIKEERRKQEISDGVEIALIIMGFIFALIFLIRLGEDIRTKDQFLVQNGTNLIVASILSVLILALFMKKVEGVRFMAHLKLYALGGALVGIDAYLLALFELPPVGIWLSLVLGSLGLALLSIHSLRAKDPGAYRFSAGMWAVMIISIAMGLDLIRVSNFSGLLLFVALAGLFIGIFGLLQIIDERREVFDRFGYSASIFCIFLIWLSTSRVAASGVVTGYSEVDGVMVGTGVVFGMMGASVLTHKRYLDTRLRKAISDGHEAYREGEYDEAIENYDRALALSPKSKVARTCKADALGQLERYDEALKIYDSVIREDMDYSPAISGKGSSLRQKGEFAKSVIYLQKALNLDPRSKVAWNNKGNAFFFLDQLKTAIFCYKKAIELDPNYSGAWYNLAVAHTNSGSFIEADHAFSTAANILERLGKKPLLKDTRTTDTKDLTDMLRDLPQDIDLEILSGDVEKRVLSHISFNPGLTKEEVIEALTLGQGEAKAVLGSLVKGHLVTSKRDRTKVRYYPQEQLPVTIHVMEMDEGSIEEKRVRYLTDLQRSILETIEDHPDIGVKEISMELGISQQVVEFHLGTLEKGDLVHGKRVGLERRYHV